MTGEALGLLMEKVRGEGALDISYFSCYMKKNRPGISIQILAKEEDLDKMTELIFKYSTSIGFRFQLIERRTMDRKFITRKTELGEIREKISSYGHVVKSKLEFDDIKEKI